MSVLFAVEQHNRLEMLIFVVELSAELLCCRADEVRHMLLECKKKKKKNICVHYRFPQFHKPLLYYTTGPDAFLYSMLAVVIAYTPSIKLGRGPNL